MRADDEDFDRFSLTVEQRQHEAVADGHKRMTFEVFATTVANDKLFP
jgi:hypothetical protein